MTNLMDWINSLPSNVQVLALKYPPGTLVCATNGVTYYTVGFAEVESGPPALYVSFINPYEDYDRAIEERFLVCSSHLLESGDKKND